MGHPDELPQQHGHSSNITILTPKAILEEAKTKSTKGNDEETYFWPLAVYLPWFWRAFLRSLLLLTFCAGRKQMEDRNNEI